MKKFTIELPTEEYDAIMEANSPTPNFRTPLFKITEEQEAKVKEREKVMPSAEERVKLAVKNQLMNRYVNSIAEEKKLKEVEKLKKKHKL